MLLAIHFVGPMLAISLGLETFRPLAKKAEAVKKMVDPADGDSDQRLSDIRGGIRKPAKSEFFLCMAGFSFVRYQK